MKNSKNNKTIIKIIVFIVITLIVLCTLVLTKKSNSNSNNIIDENNKTYEELNEKYNLGDIIKISKLSSIDFSTVGNDDFSNWHVLEDEEEYITLLSDTSLYKGDLNNSKQLSNLKKIFEENGIKFGPKGEIRLIDDKDLTKYFACNLNDLKCNPIYTWLGNLKTYKNTLTSVVKNDKIVILNFDYTLKLDKKEDALYPIFPIIKILKTSIK